MDEFEDVPLWYQRHKLDCCIVKDLDTGMEEAVKCQSEDQDTIRDRKKDIDNAATNAEMSNACALQETEEPKSEDQDIVRDVWFYVLDNFKESMTKWKYLDNYDSNGDQGLPYDEGLDDEDWEMDYSLITETINVDIPVEHWVEGMPEGWKGGNPGRKPSNLSSSNLSSYQYSVL